MRPRVTLIEPPGPSDYEAYMLRLVNEQRRKHSLPELRWNATLAGMARQHSEEMMRLGYFSHTSPAPEYRTMQDRASVAGLSAYQRITENIAVAPYFDVTGLVMPGMRLVEAAMHGDTMSREYYTAEGRTIVHHTDLINIGGFMQSAGHRKNILDPAVNYAGLGISAGNGIYNGKRTRGMWVTQNFARL